MGLWDENAGLVVAEQLAGEVCYGGLDLASTSDFAAWVLFFPGAEEDHVLARFWLPQAAVERRAPMRDRLEAWARDGFLAVTPGDTIDYGAIRTQVDLDAKTFRIRRVGYDRWNATEVIGWMRGHGLRCEGVAQTTTQLNQPSKELERRLGLRRVRHGGHPVLRWMADSVLATSDASGNIKPDRAKSREKIDGIAALVDAMHQYLEAESEGRPFAFVVS
jgi:phage terminase large subunit-like protein